MEIIKRPSPNHSSRKGRTIDMIVIHDTQAKTAESTISWFATKVSGVSSHYLVDKDGTIYQFVDEDRSAWHAGQSHFMGEGNINNCSVGIELVDDDDTDKYPEAQSFALIELCADLCFNYRIPLNRIWGHADIAIPKGRKKDPGVDFNWFIFLTLVGAHLADRIEHEPIS